MITYKRREIEPLIILIRKLKSFLKKRKSKPMNKLFASLAIVATISQVEAIAWRKAWKSACSADDPDCEMDKEAFKTGFMASRR